MLTLVDWQNVVSKMEYVQKAYNEYQRSFLIFDLKVVASCHHCIPK